MRRPRPAILRTLAALETYGCNISLQPPDKRLLEIERNGWATRYGVLGQLCMRITDEGRRVLGIWELAPRGKVRPTARSLRRPSAVQLQALRAAQRGETLLGFMWRTTEPCVDRGWIEPAPSPDDCARYRLTALGRLVLRRALDGNAKRRLARRRRSTAARWTL